MINKSFVHFYNNDVSINLMEGINSLSICKTTLYGKKENNYSFITAIFVASKEKLGCYYDNEY